MKDRFPPSTRVDLIYEGDRCVVEDTTFTLTNLKGYSFNQTGIATPDNVIFVGDAFLDQEELSQLKMLYNFDTNEAMNSMRSLVNTNYRLYVPSHGKPTENIKNSIEYNLGYLEDKFEMVLKLLKGNPLSIDTLMGILVSKYRVTQHPTQYYIAQACITSILSYLENSGQIGICFNKGVIKYMVKQ